MSLRLKNLEFGSVKALTPPVNLELEKNGLFALLGKNGIGKSTLLRTIAAQQEPLSGSLFINGKSIQNLDRVELAKRVNYVPAQFDQPMFMSVRECVLLGRIPHRGLFRQFSKSDKKKMKESLAAVGLMGFEDRMVDTLSDGERQRVTIARSLTQNTDILLLDEPTAFLDAGAKMTMMNLLSHLSKDKLIICSSHDIGLSTKVSDAFLMLDANGLNLQKPKEAIKSGAVSRLYGSANVQSIDLDFQSFVN